MLIFTSKAGDGGPLLWKTGVYICVVDPVKNKLNGINFQLNAGEGKYYPGGPKCTYNGKQVDCPSHWRVVR